MTPEPFREFLPYVSPSALRIMHTDAVLSRALSIAAGKFRSSELRARSESLRAILNSGSLDSRIRIVEAIEPVFSLGDPKKRESEIRREIGERVLELYFRMTCAGGPLFLDLRPTNFGWRDGFLEFAPPAISLLPDEDFTKCVADLYAGFYLHDETRFRRGMELYAWKCKPRDGYLERLHGMLREHFGAAERGTMQFEIANFRATFHQIFVAATEERAKFHPDLAFLGAALVGVYLTLGALDIDVSPYAAYSRAVP